MHQARHGHWTPWRQANAGDARQAAQPCGIPWHRHTWGAAVWARQSDDRPGDHIGADRTEHLRPDDSVLQVADRYTLTSPSGSPLWSFGRDGQVKVPIPGSLHADNGVMLMRAPIAGQGLLYEPRFITAAALGFLCLAPTIHTQHDPSASHRIRVLRLCSPPNRSRSVVGLSCPLA